MDELLGEWSDPASAAEEFSEAIRGRIKSELHPGERLLWASRSWCRQEPTSYGILILVLLAIVLFLWALRSLLIVSRNPLGPIEGIAFFGFLAGAIALIMIFSLFARAKNRREERERAANTLYALTDRRAILWTATWPRRKGGVEIKSIARGRLGNVHRIEYPDGYGDVIFGYHKAAEEDFVSWGSSGFEGVPEVRRVEELVRRIMLEGGDESRVER